MVERTQPTRSALRQAKPRSAPTVPTGPLMAPPQAGLAFSCAYGLADDPAARPEHPQMPLARGQARQMSASLRWTTKPWAGHAAVWGEQSAKQNWMAWCITWAMHHIANDPLLSVLATTDDRLREEAEELCEDAWRRATIIRRQFIRRVHLVREASWPRWELEMADIQDALTVARQRMHEESQGRVFIHAQTPEQRGAGRFWCSPLWYRDSQREELEAMAMFVHDRVPPEAPQDAPQDHPGPLQDPASDEDEAAPDDMALLQAGPVAWADALVQSTDGGSTLQHGRSHVASASIASAFPARPSADADAWSELCRTSFPTSALATDYGSEPCGEGADTDGRAGRNVGRAEGPDVLSIPRGPNTQEPTVTQVLDPNVPNPFGSLPTTTIPPRDPSMLYCPLFALPTFRDTLRKERPPAVAHLTIEAMLATGVLEGPAQMAMTYF